MSTGIQPTGIFMRSLSCWLLRTHTLFIYLCSRYSSFHSLSHYFIACPVGCTTCTSSASCQTCAYGYKLSPSAISVKETTCVLELTEDEIEQTKAIAASSSVMKSIGRIATQCMSLLNFKDTSALYLGAYTNMFSYIKYLQVYYPPKVQINIDTEISFSFNIVPDIPDSLAAKFPNTTIPAKFAQYGIDANFLVNYWSDLLSLIISLFALAIACLFKLYLTKYQFVQKLCVKTIETLKWNFILMTLLSNYSETMLFTSIQVRAAQFHNGPATFSFVLCIAINLISLVILFRAIFIIYCLRTTQRRTNPEEDVERMKLAEEKYRNYSILFDSCKSASATQQAFTCIYCGYLYLFYAIIAYLYKYVMLQAVLHAVLSCVFLLYLIVRWPLKQRFDTIKMIVQQAMMVTINTSVLGLAYLDSRQSYGEDSRGGLGNTILITKATYSYLLLAYSALSLIGDCVRAVRYLINRCRRREKSNIEISRLQNTAVNRSALHESSIIPIVRDRVSLHDISHEEHSQLPLKNASNLAAKVPLSQTVTRIEKKKLFVPHRQSPMEHVMNQIPPHLEKQGTNWEPSPFENMRELNLEQVNDDMSDVRKVPKLNTKKHRFKPRKSGSGRMKVPKDEWRDQSIN